MILVIDFSKQSDKARLFEELKKLKTVSYQIEIREDRDQRSGNQNRYYFGCVIKILSDETGFERNEMHEHLKLRFLKYYKPLPNGEFIELVKSTKDLDTKEMEDYLEKIRMFAAQELDVQIPLPNEYLEI